MKASPKKDVKKGGKEPEEIKPEPAEPVEQNIVHIETEGFGKFEFIDGTIYEGQWKLIDNIKMRHGEGTLRHPGSSSETAEEYRGSWFEDKMHGYGVYRYTSGAIYSGEWNGGTQHGQGLYEFPDGSKYEGEWKNHKMDGDGIFTDLNGNKWEGIFVDGIFQSKIQKQLKYEKQLKIMEGQILASAKEFLTKFEKAFVAANNDKKILKETLPPFFAVLEDTKTYFKDPFPKYDERPPEKWNSAFVYLSDPVTVVNALKAPENARIVNPDHVLLSQFNGLGQVVEFERAAPAPERTVKLALCNVAQDTWVPVYFFDTVGPKDK